MKEIMPTYLPIYLPPPNFISFRVQSLRTALVMEWVCRGGGGGGEVDVGAFTK